MPPEDAQNDTDGGTASEEWDGDRPPAPSNVVFEDLQREIDDVDPEGVLQHPEYLGFLEDFGQLDATEDVVGLDELVDADREETGSDGTTAPSSAAREETGSDGATEPSPADPEETESELVTRLLAELRSDSVTRTQRARVRDALGLRRRKAVEVQVNHLRSRFLDLEAYIRAMEDAFDAGGHPIEEVEALRDDLAALAESVDDEADRLESAARATAVLAARHEERGSELASVERTAGETTAALERNLAVIEDELNEHGRWRERVAAAARSEAEGAPEEVASNRRPTGEEPTDGGD